MKHEKAVSHLVLQICSKCDLGKTLDYFPRNRNRPNGRDAECLTCKREREKSPESRKLAKNRVLKKKYGIDLQTYQSLSQYQGGRCAICKTKQPSLCVDHSHTTGAVRGLLCRGCNWAVGHFRDSPKNAVRAAAYLMDSGGDS